MADQLDLVNRDPHNMNNFLQVEFDDTLGEPAGTHSSECVWRNSYKCFTCGKNLAYSICSFFCGIFIALYWGCTFGCLAFKIIWCVTPLMRLLHIILHPTKKILAIILMTFVGPCVETAGLLFSRIHVVNSQGPPPKSLDRMDGDDGQRK
jgi:hypothetical protein